MLLSTEHSLSINLSIISHLDGMLCGTPHSCSNWSCYLRTTIYRDVPVPPYKTVPWFPFLICFCVVISYFWNQMTNFFFLDVLPFLMGPFPHFLPENGAWDTNCLETLHISNIFILLTHMMDGWVTCTP